MAQIIDEVSNNDLLDIRIPVERKGKDLILTPEILALLYPDSTGRLRTIVNTSGEISESHGASIETQVTANQVTQLVIKNLITQDTFDGGMDDNTDSWRGQKKIMFVPVTTDGAGDVADIVLQGAIAGYQSCIRLDYIFALGTDGAWDATIDSTSGLSGPGVMTGLASVANAVGPDWRRGLFFQNTADNETIKVTIANGGNTITYYFAGVRWWET